MAAAKLDAYWSHLRMTDSNLIGNHFSVQPESPLSGSLIATPIPSKSPLLTEALNIYVAQKGAKKSKTYKGAALRAFRFLVTVCGDKRLASYTRDDALKYRYFLVNKGSAGASVGRVLSSIKSIFNFVVSEQALELKNPFIGLYYDKDTGVRDFL